MWFYSSQFKSVKRPAHSPKIDCTHCNNRVSAELVVAPKGIGVGIPPFVATTGKQYALQCPICGTCYELSKDEAKGLML